ncbi:MAG: hypothetical protein ABR505_03550 [Actinomycetota bacterium]
MKAPARFWFVVPVDEDGLDDVGFAMPLRRDRERDLAHSHQMLDGEPIEHWEVEEFELEGGGFGDFPRELRGYRLCSDRLRNVIENMKGPADPLEWLPAKVRGPAGEIHDYWVLNLLRHPATDLPGLEDLDWGTLRQYAQEGKLSSFRILPPPGHGLISFLVPDSVRQAILDSGCRVSFRPL